MLHCQVDLDVARVEAALLAAVNGDRGACLFETFPIAQWMASRRRSCLLSGTVDYWRPLPTVAPGHFFVGGGESDYLQVDAALQGCMCDKQFYYLDGMIYLLTGWCCGPICKVVQADSVRGTMVCMAHHLVPWQRPLLVLSSEPLLNVV